MSRDWRVSDSVVIAVDPMTVYRHISDPMQMGKWSPENRGAKPTNSDELKPGMFFDGINKRGPLLRWVGRCRVLAAEPGKRFTFRTEQLGAFGVFVKGGIATWDYELEEVGGGTKVTETWIDNRHFPDAVWTALDPILTGSRTFADFQRKNIASTLKRLKRELER